MENKYIKIENSIGASQQRQLIELSTNLAKALNEDEFLKIILIYNNVIDRLVKQAEKEGIEI